MTSGLGCPALDSIRARLNYLHDIEDKSWRKIAALDEYRGIPAGSLCSYAKGRIPKNPEHRRILGLPLMIEIEGRKYELREIA